jgi:hypothetical protein
LGDSCLSASIITRRLEASRIAHVGLFNFSVAIFESSDTPDIAFMVVMAFGWLICIFIAPPSRVIRADGSRVQARKAERSSLTLRHQVSVVINSVH